VGELDRMAGTLLGLAAGDALGAGYEFAAAPTGEVDMIGGGLGGTARGEWTDDTAMAVGIAEVAATGHLDPVRVGERFLDWMRSDPPDTGIATAAVLRDAATAADLPRAARRHLETHPRGGAGNGALMRTAPVALAHLGDDEAMAAAAREMAEMTHADPLAGDSCVLWCVAIDRAVRERRLDGVRDGLALLPEARRDRWRVAIDEAETGPPERFAPNGFTVTALQAAHATIHHTAVPPDRPGVHLQLALDAAVRIGDDTDTVAAIAGALLGARWGASAVPFRWRRLLHGWPGLDAGQLVRLAVLAGRRGRPDHDGWPVVARQRGEGVPPYVAMLPGDEHVLLGNLASLDEVAGGVGAIVSLCRVGAEQVSSEVEHHEVWLADTADPDANPNLELVLDDTVDAIRTLRAEGRRVFLHCAAGRSRAPTVAAAYLAAVEDVPATRALERVVDAIPVHDAHNEAFRDLLERR
jgi:ADP-ribosyl-[dinitrogen reductase] hydrolase